LERRETQKEAKEQMMDTDARLLIKVPLRVMAISAGYSAALAMIERKFRLKPDHEWLEVAIGVGLTLVPLAVEAHSIEGECRDTKSESMIDWKTYEGALWRSFMASGAPVIVWQIGEAIWRKWELMGYLTDNERRSGKDANTAAQMAYRSGESAEGGIAGSNGSYKIFAGGSGES
jgi:hypothetical protein